MANGNLSIYIVLMETCVSITLILKNVNEIRTQNTDK